ncbi:hypothetical protein [Cohnella mopanensis]|uniref:hypothetical protein n=1 Tax=Cohnella mopanensis TaxID=2911966 RepID=UPI001EF8783A|nr:hypothetical protein [Cohnella mopanensis]
MTLVKMKQRDFDLLSEDSLGRACMEPIFQQIRGKNLPIKTQVISELNKGQQALCMFRVMYDHAKNSAAEFYCWMSYLLDQPGYWYGVMGGLSFFGDHAMHQLLEETKEILQARNLKLSKQWSDASMSDLDKDEELHINVVSLFDRFQLIAPLSHGIISSFIRSNPHEFVVIEA